MQYKKKPKCEHRKQGHFGCCGKGGLMCTLKRIYVTDECFTCDAVQRFEPIVETRTEQEEFGFVESS